jgi:hypothetical protein
MPHLDTCYSRVLKMKSLLGISRLYGCKDRVNIQLGKKLNGVFDRFWIGQVNAQKLDSDGVDHNKGMKIRLYTFHIKVVVYCVLPVVCHRHLP